MNKMVKTLVKEKYEIYKESQISQQNKTLEVSCQIKEKMKENSKMKTDIKSEIPNEVRNCWVPGR